MPASVAVGTSSALIKLLLIGHALVAGALAGSLTHLVVVTVRAGRGRVNERLLRLYPAVALASWAAVFALGSLIYPTYRVRVRAEHLDVEARWASILFDLKENFAVLIAPLLVALFVLSRSPRELAKRPAFHVAAWASAAVVWFNLVAGLLVASVRSVS
jgi:hypothetical protein